MCQSLVTVLTWLVHASSATAMQGPLAYRHCRCYWPAVHRDNAMYTYVTVALGTAERCVKIRAQPVNPLHSTTQRGGACPLSNANDPLMQLRTGHLRRQRSVKCGPCFCEGRMES